MKRRRAVRRLSLLVCLGLQVATVACERPASAPAVSAPAAPVTAPDPALVADNAAWRTSREASLRRPDSWFTLVGLHWFSPGDNTFGSDASNKLRFPANAPAKMGTLRWADGKVTLTAEPGAGLTVDGQPATTNELEADTTGDPTVVTAGSLSFYVIQRGNKTGVRVKDTEAPALKAFKNLDYYPLDAAWRIVARLERNPGTVAIPNVLGQVTEAPSPGTLVFEYGGKTYRLHPTGEDGAEGLSLVFGDATNGRGTYGGGRFLHADAADDEDRVILDFNRAYNPPCAYSPYATCPLPPPENKLSVAIEAGEKTYTGLGHSAH